jgi:succinate dehydrogenase / fumarate reductase cytochrome b subunit
MSRPRPKYLNLLHIRLPVPGLVSILHRASGAVLFLFIPFLLVLLELTLESPAGFLRFKSVLSHWAVKLLVIGLVWAYLHHLLAGIRHLALDLDCGTELPVARATSTAVLAAAVVLAVAFGVAIW